MELRDREIPTSIAVITVFRDVLLPGGVIKVPIQDDMKESLRFHGSEVIGVIPSESTEQKVEEGDIGTAGLLLSLTTANYDTLPSNIVVVGLKRFVVKKVLSTKPLYTAQILVHIDSNDNIDKGAIAVLNKAKKYVLPMVAGIPTFSSWYGSSLKRDLDKLPVPALFDIVFSLSPVTFEEKLSILKTLNPAERIAYGMTILLGAFGLGSGNQNKSVMRYLPGNGMTAVRIYRKGDLTKDSPGSEDSDIAELKKKLQDAKLPEYASKTVTREMDRLKRLIHYSPEYPVIRSYLEFIADLPWSVSSNDTLDISKAKEDLDSEHYGMEKLKTRVLEYLAVCQLRAGMKGPILCFVGPPGVGKTSIGRVIARVLNKNFQRISVGGISNQSEIRGHRRTYVGSLPGRILQALKQAGTNNPVILLDEIDKVGHNTMGSPKDALLEVLDPEQNAHFTDLYLGMPFDLSKVTFIATANSLKGIPLPLIDRMEIIHVSGYTQIEKFNIGARHLIPKQLDLHGLKPGDLQFTDDAVYSIIRDYTREAGVRSLERKLADICRAAALRIANLTFDSLPIMVDKDNLQDILGVGVNEEEGVWESGRPGVAVGMCWSNVGGNLVAVEASGGNGNLILTGRLGDVMRESAQIALSWVRSVQHKYGLLEDRGELLPDRDLHIHFPAGAVSKDGPSAGITIACAVLSLFTGVPIAPRLAMTGELTLQGRVLSVGGLKEKLAAANRMGIKKVIVPLKCKKSLSDIPESILAGLEIVLVENMAEVVEAAFDGLLTARGNADSLLCSKL